MGSVDTSFGQHGRCSSCKGVCVLGWTWQGIAEQTELNLSCFSQCSLFKVLSLEDDGEIPQGTLQGSNTQRLISFQAS